MPDNPSKARDLAAIKAGWELNYTIARQPNFAGNRIVQAALANAEASDAAFLAAVAEADAAHGFRIIKTYRHVRRTAASSEKAHAALRAAIERAEACDEIGIGTSSSVLRSSH